MPTGILTVFASIAQQAAPLQGVRVRVFDESGAALHTAETGADGRAASFALPAPDRRYSLDEDNTDVRPYAVYTLLAEKAGWRSVRVEGVQVFDGQEAIARLEFLPAEAAQSAPAPYALDRIAEAAIVIPPHPLFAEGSSQGGSGPAPRVTCPARVLPQVVVPKRITVHLGAPNASASNVTVDFQTYIATVASCEVYPTWPEQALRANILAQISLALNRIFTEWYPSRGYSFNITGSPSYDQAYTRGHTVYAVMERLTAELFNTYVRRSGDNEPYYTEYCDGRLVTCPGMKQWGTVERANAGLSALEILRYYYGSRVELVTSSNIASIPQSYGGTALRRGDTGVAVATIQRQLSRIAKDYPSFGKPAVTGTFDAATEAAVRNFQRYFSLTVDGVVGRATWYKISYIYVSVKDLAELTSEGEDYFGAEAPGVWPGRTLRRGATGTDVELVQFWLSELARFDASLLNVTVDGSFGAATESAVKAFQRFAGLAADGIVGRATWTALYEAWLDVQSDLGGTAWPGTVLRQGATGNSVRLVQLWLRLAAGNYPTLPAPDVDGVFGAGTATAVRGFQSLLGLAEDGAVGPATWERLRETAVAVIEDLVEPGMLPGQFPGTLREGSAGTGVRAVQYYLRLLSAYYSTIPAVTVDGRFGAATRSAVLAWQRRAGLAADGIVGPATWESIYQAAQSAAASGPAVRRRAVPALTRTLTAGDSGADVRAVSEAMLFLGAWLPELDLYGLPAPTEDLTPGLETAVRSAQRLFGLAETGTVTPEDWAVYVAAAAELYAATPASPEPRPAGVWPGSTLAPGSSGPAVWQVQRWLNTLAGVDCAGLFVPEDGILNGQTRQALELYQLENGLTDPETGTPPGFVDDATWQSLRAAAEAAVCPACPLPDTADR